MTDSARKKRDEWIVRIGLLAMAAVFGYSFIFKFLYNARAQYWLTVDAKQTMALIIKELEHGVVEYKYSVAGTEYNGASQRNWEQKKYRDVGVGQESIVFYSASHPWLSSLTTPQFPPAGTVVLFIALLMEFYLIVAALNPAMVTQNKN